MEELLTKYVHLQTPHGIAIGTFVVLVPGLLYIATGDVKRKGVRVKQGVWFVFDQGNSAFNAKVFAPYDSAYGVIRAFSTYAKGWTEMQLQVVGGLHALAEASLADIFGVQTLELGEYEAIDAQLRDVIKTGGVSATTNRKVQHAVGVFNRTRTTTRKGSRVLGFANSAGKFADRLSEVEGDHTFVTTIGTVVAQYMGSVLDVVKAERAKIDKIMALNTDALLTEENAHALLVIGKQLFETLVARPTTHVGDNATVDCGKAAEMIRAAVAAGAAGRSGASEGVRNLLGNVRDSLDLLVWQYDEEQLVMSIAGPVRHKSVLADEEWSELFLSVHQLVVRVAEPFGSRFANARTMKDIRMHLRVARDAAHSPSDADPVIRLATVKMRLVLASKCV